jgi:hypothetical protein
LLALGALVAGRGGALGRPRMFLSAPARLQRHNAGVHDAHDRSRNHRGRS